MQSLVVQINKRAPNMQPYFRRSGRNWVLNQDEINVLVDGFAMACSQIPNLKEAALVTDLEERVEVQHPTTKSRDSFEADGEWGIYFAAPGYASPWFRSLDPYLHAVMQRRLAEDLSAPRLTFNTRRWYPDNDLLALLVGASNDVNNLHIVRQDLWRGAQRTVMKKLWRRQQRSSSNSNAPPSNTVS